MPRFDLPQQGTFMQLAGAVATVYRSLRVDVALLLAQDGCCARWRPMEPLSFHSGRTLERCQPIRPVRDRGDALIVVSAPFAATETRQMLATLTQDGALTLFPDVTARAPTIPLSPGGYYWQEPVPFLPSEAADVAESAPWRYLRIAHTETFPNDFERQARLTRVVAPDLAAAQRSEFRGSARDSFLCRTARAESVHS